MTSVIPTPLLKPGMLVHVEGWKFACQFRYVGTDIGGWHLLITPKTKREFSTRNRLLFTRQNYSIFTARTVNKRNKPGRVALPSRSSPEATTETANPMFAGQTTGRGAACHATG